MTAFKILLQSSINKIPFHHSKIYLMSLENHQVYHVLCYFVEHNCLFICCLHVQCTWNIESSLKNIYSNVYGHTNRHVVKCAHNTWEPIGKQLPDRLNLGQTCLNCRCFYPHCLWRTPRSTIQGVLDVSVIERLLRQSRVESWHLPANGRCGGAGLRASVRQSELLVMLGSPGESALDTIALRDYSEWVCYKQLDLHNR